MRLNKSVMFVFLIASLLLFGILYVLNVAFQNEIFQVDTWQISQSEGLSARVYWQLEIPCLRMIADHPNNLISSASSTVTVYRNCLTHAREVMTLDSESGRVLWKSDVFADIYALDTDGQNYYGLEGDRIVIFDQSGQKRHFSNQFISRSVRSFFVSNSHMYIPFRTSSETGTYIYGLSGEGVINTQRLENISSVSGERIISINGNTAVVLDENFETVLNIQIQVTSSELEYAVLVESVLILFEERYGLAAYDIDTAQRIWEIPADLQTFPVVSDGKVYIMEANVVTVYEVTSGTQLGIIELSNSEGAEAGTTMMAVNGNYMFLGFSNQKVIMAIEIEF